MLTSNRNKCTILNTSQLSRQALEKGCLYMPPGRPAVFDERRTWALSLDGFVWRCLELVKQRLCVDRGQLARYAIARALCPFLDNIDVSGDLTDEQKEDIDRIRALTQEARNLLMEDVDLYPRADIVGD